MQLRYTDSSNSPTLQLRIVDNCAPEDPGHAISGLALGIVLWETVRMTERPSFKRVGASTYACTVCSNFKVEIVKPSKMNAGQWRKHLDARLVQHIQKYHSKSERA